MDEIWGTSQPREASVPAHRLIDLTVVDKSVVSREYCADPRVVVAA